MKPKIEEKMAENRYFLDFEVEAHLCLKDGLEEIHSSHPIENYEIHFKNLSTETDVDRPLLTVHMIIYSESIEEAEENGKERLKEYLHVLSFVTGSLFKIHKLRRVVDWTIGLSERDYIHYQPFPGAEIPRPHLDERHIQTVESIEKIPKGPAFRRVLKWFASGVSSAYLDDQFQYFWFVIEILSQINKEPRKVNDLCEICKTALYCEKCETYPTHRPHPKQAIQQLLERTIDDDPDAAFQLLSEIRNRLMHGDAIEDIEKKMDISFEEIIDKVAQIAWIAIMNSFDKEFQNLSLTETLTIIRPGSFVHRIMTVRVHLSFGSSDPDKPALSDLPNVNISSEFVEVPQPPSDE